MYVCVCVCVYVCAYVCVCVCVYDACNGCALLRRADKVTAAPSDPNAQHYKPRTMTSSFMPATKRAILLSKIKCDVYHVMGERQKEVVGRPAAQPQATLPTSHYVRFNTTLTKGSTCDSWLTTISCTSALVNF